MVRIQGGDGIARARRLKDEMQFPFLALHVHNITWQDRVEDVGVKHEEM